MRGPGIIAYLCLALSFTVVAQQAQNPADKPIENAVEKTAQSGANRSFQATQDSSNQATAQEDDVWLDDMHKSISESVIDTAQWLDDFFVNKNAQEDKNALGEVRLRLGWEPRSRDLNEFEAKLKVRVKLPNLRNKVDLILSDYEDDRDDKVSAGRENALNREDRFSLALRFKPRPDSGISHRIGTGRRFQYFVKSRYQKQLAVSSSTDLRYDVAAYYYNRDKLGADVGFTVDYAFEARSVLRFRNRFYYRDKSIDWLWQHSVQHLKQFDDTTAMVGGFYIEGLSRPNYHLTEYLLSLKLRKNYLREWLFFDVEPFILWRRDESFSASYGLALRVEGYFGET